MNLNLKNQTDPSELLLLLNSSTGLIELSSGTNLFAGCNSPTEPQIVEFLHQRFKIAGTDNFRNNWATCLQLNSNSKHYFSIPLTGLGEAASLHVTGLRGSSETITILVKHIPDNKWIAGINEDFLRHAAHDLHSPLRKLNTLVSRLVSKLPQDEDLDQYTSRIQTSILQMQQLVDDITDLSSINQESLKIARCDLNDVVAKALNDLGPEYKSGAVIERNSLPVIAADTEKIKRLFRELIKNALMYKKPGSDARVSIAEVDAAKYKSAASDEAMTCIQISDEGVGIANDKEDEVFLPFKRLHGKSEYPGTGMGLAICKKIAECHGGMIFAESNSERTRFTIILPYTKNPHAV